MKGERVFGDVVSHVSWENLKVEELRHSDVVELPVSRRLEGYKLIHQNAIHTTSSSIISQHHLHTNQSSHT
jgi:hypothetical protein